jgi:hypothetical protein
MVRNGVRALAHWQCGRHSAALSLAKTASDLAKSLSSPTLGTFAGVAAALEVLLAAHEARVHSTTSNVAGLAVFVSGRLTARSLASLCSATLDILSQHAKVLPVLRARELRAIGLHKWTTGHRKTAVGHWRASLAVAVTSSMQYDEALAHYELGRHANTTALAPEEARGHAEKAKEMLAALGCVPTAVFEEAE